VLEAIPVVCPLRATTGLDCPLCGATRATFALLRGDVARALDLNALYVLALPFLAVVAIVWFRAGRTPALLGRSGVRWVALGLAVAFTVARNLPPFTVLGS